MVSNLYKKDIRDDETYITLYGVFACDRESTKYHKYLYKENGRYYYDMPFQKCAKDITQSWKINVKKGGVYKSNEIEFRGKKYVINGRNYKDDDISINFDEPGDIERKEKKVIDIIHKETKAEIEIYPRIEWPEKEKTPDLLLSKWKNNTNILIGKDRWDIKSLEKNINEYGKTNKFFDNIKDKKGQAENFIFDIGKDADKAIVKDWVKKTFMEDKAKFAKKIMIIADGKIYGIYAKRKWKEI